MFLRCENKKIVNLAKKTVLIWTIAVVFWILDRVFCDFWLSINLPYFHSVFHLIAFYSAYWSIVLYSFFKAIDTVPQLKVSINYWPERENLSLIAIPYIQFFNNSTLSNVDNNYVIVGDVNDNLDANETVSDQNYKFA